MFPQNSSLPYLPQSQYFYKILLKNGVITLEYHTKSNRVSMLTNPGSCLSSSGLPPAFHHTAQDGICGIKQRVSLWGWMVQISVGLVVIVTENIVLFLQIIWRLDCDS
jgi:hypothetical protein